MVRHLSRLDQAIRTGMHRAKASVNGRDCPVYETDKADSRRSLVQVEIEADQQVQTDVQVADLAPDLEA